MFTITAAAAAITGYLAKSLKENKSIASFFTDFTDASVSWIKPVFLKENGESKKALKDLEQNPDDKTLQDELQKRIEIAAEDDDNALAILNDMVKIIAEKTGQTFTTHGDNSKIVGRDDHSHNNSHNNSHNRTNSNNTTTNNHHNITQSHTGTGDIIGRDKITTTNYYGSNPNKPVLPNTWQALLAKGKIQDTIEMLLKENVGDQDSINMLFGLQGQFSINESDFNKGKISMQDANVVRSRIANALLETFNKA